MFIHPAVHLDITRWRHEAVLAPAKRYPLPDARCAAALVAEAEEAPAPSLLGRLRRLRRPRRILQDARESA